MIKKYFSLFFILFSLISAYSLEKNGMIFVKGGVNKNADSNYYKKNAVCTDFWIGKYEVTQKEWADVMGSNPSNFKGENTPVECVSWYDCVEYCNKRSLMEGFTPYYNVDKSAKDTNNKNNVDSKKWIVTINRDANGYRLPSEAEWEYAASGGMLSKNYKYSGADNFDDVSWCKGNAHETTHTVGSKKANELGLFDMSGNVAEWCFNWYDTQIIENGGNTTGPDFGAYRIFKGGSWEHDIALISLFSRLNISPAFAVNFIGFRLTRSNK